MRYNITVNLINDEQPFIAYGLSMFAVKMVLNGHLQKQDFIDFTIERAE